MFALVIPVIIVIHFSVLCYAIYSDYKDNSGGRD